MHTDNVRLLLDGRWSLEELAATGRAYNQVYSFAYTLLPDLAQARLSEVRYVYANLPWRGGYSTVNFFFNIFKKIPHEAQPQIKQIKYASPGFIELAEILAVAIVVSRFVKTVCSMLIVANDTYRHIQKGVIEHQLNKATANLKELELAERQRTFCERSSKQLSEVLGMTDEEQSTLDTRVNGNQLMKLKLLLSVFRRVEPLAVKQKEGKLDVTDKKVE
ncbi:hypothetical protein ACEK06_16475 [Pseudomonas brenneri]|uniref:hypothetical protein n=1 Tax=Pseudomonas brenneri TaxID=129817 RepID=UPI0035712EF9